MFRVTDSDPSQPEPESRVTGPTVTPGPPGVAAGNLLDHHDVTDRAALVAEPWPPGPGRGGVRRRRGHESSSVRVGGGGGLGEPPMAAALRALRLSVTVGRATGRRTVTSSGPAARACPGPAWPAAAARAPAAS